MAKNRGLGRGLDTIYADNLIDEKDKEVTSLRINMIQPRSDQPRSHFDKESLQELADSIAVHGVIQPLLVRRGEGDIYEIIAGERRWRAAKMAALTQVPVIVVEADELKTAQLALIENMQREDLNPVEEALACEALIRNYGMTQDEAARQLGKSRSGLANMLRILDLPDEALDMVRTGELSYGAARALLGLNDKSKIVPLANRIVSRKLSVRGAEDAVRRENESPREQSEDPASMQIDYYAEVERRIFAASGIRVRVRKVRGGRTRMEIVCINNEELDDIIKLLCADAYEVE